jgi:hypothetical protein
MKKLVAILALVLGMMISTQAQTDIPSAKPGIQYGKAINKDNAISVAQLEKSFKSDSTFTGKIVGEVVEVCKKKGCFITIKREGDAEPIMVRFKDYEFFMPQDIVGKTIVLEGEAKRKETSVAWLKHYAEDAGKSAEEIAKITKPKVDINIIADGVIVVK